MSRGAVLAGAAATIAAASGLAWFALTERNRRDELVLPGGRVYAGRCASCHGVKLQGQPNWQTRLANVLAFIKSTSPEREREYH